MPKFHILNAAGTLCCAADSPSMLCDKCRIKATVAFSDPPAPPPPPRLEDVLREPSRPAEPVAWPGRSDIDDPPSLSDALTDQFKKGVRV